MLKRQACAKFQSQIFDESEVIQILKVVRWHFCQVYMHKPYLAYQKVYTYMHIEHTIKVFCPFRDSVFICKKSGPICTEPELGHK